MKLENNIKNQNLKKVGACSAYSSMQDMHHSPTDNTANNTAESNTAKTNERGSTMVEYALLVALMSIGCIASIGAARVGVEDKFLEIQQAIAQGGQEQN